MSLLNLPEPPNWAESGRLPLWVRLGLLVALVYMIGQGALVVAGGSYLTATVWFGTFGPLFLLMLALALAPKRVVRARTTSDHTRLTVWPDKTFTVLYFACFALTVPFAAMFAILLPRGMIDIDTTRGMQLFFPIEFAALAVVATMGLVAGVRRRGVGYLKFTPAMIEIADVLKTKTLEWNDIVDVMDHSDTKDGNKAGRSVVLCLRDGTEEVVSGLNLYLPTGVPLYWMVRHYWKHPEDRMELVDHRAAERFSGGHFALD